MPAVEPWPAAVINDDEVGAAFFDEFRADTRPGARGDNRLALVERVIQTGDDFSTGVWVSFTCPFVWHGTGISA
jgi:hypothetical protein